MSQATARLCAAHLRAGSVLAFGAAAWATSPGVCHSGAKKRGWSACESLASPPRDFFERLSKDCFEPLLEESASWKSEYTHEGHGYKIIVSSAPSKSGLTRNRRYRVDLRLERSLAERTSPAAVFQSTMCYERRLKWDVNLDFGEILLAGEQTAPQVRPEIVRYRTTPAAGGTISSREFIDARIVLPMETGLLMVNARWDNMAKLPVARGMIRGFMIPGCCFVYICQDSQGAMNIISFGQSEIGGWLPVQLLNSASGGAYVKYAVNLLKGLGVA